MAHRPSLWNKHMLICHGTGNQIRLLVTLPQSSAYAVAARKNYIDSRAVFPGMRDITGARDQHIIWTTWHRTALYIRWTCIRQYGWHINIRMIDATKIWKWTWCVCVTCCDAAYTLKYYLAPKGSERDSGIGEPQKNPNDLFHYFSLW